MASTASTPPSALAAVSTSAVCAGSARTSSARSSPAARASARPDDGEEERRDPGARAEARLRQRGRTQVGLDDHARCVDGSSGIEVTPVDRVGAGRPAGEVDELAQPDTHRHSTVAELADEVGTVAQDGGSPALGAGRRLTPLQDGAGSQIDDAGGDLRPAHI